MAKDPAFLFYYQAFMHGTRRFTREERGLYIELLCEQADSKDGYIKDVDIKHICQECECKKVLQKFEHNSKGYYNKKLRELIKKRKDHAEKQRENVMKRWNKNGNTKDIPNLYDGNTVVLPLLNKNKTINKDINNNKGVATDFPILNENQIKLGQKIFKYFGLEFKPDPGQVQGTQYQNHFLVYRFLNLYGDTEKKLKYISHQIYYYEKYCKEFNHQSVTKIQSLLGTPDEFSGPLTQTNWKEFYNKKATS